MSGWLKQPWYLSRGLFVFHLFLLGCSFQVVAVGQDQRRTITTYQEVRDQKQELNKEKIAELDRWIEQTRKTWQVPGLSVAIVHNDQVILSKGYGVKKAGADESVDQNTLFAIASNSKAFTAAALAMLVEEKKVAWDDRVRKYLPWLELYDPWVSADLRVRDLLSHRSGLGTFSGDLLWYGTPYTPKEILERARYLKPEGPYRSHYGYSNLMFLAAGEVIEKASGLSWSEFIKQRILTPAEMKNTVCSVEDLKNASNVASPHKTFLERSDPIPWVNWDSMASAGGIISSSDDMARWLRVQLAGGKLPAGSSRLFSDASQREMWEAHTPIKISARASQRIPSTHFKAYGLGWSLADYYGRKTMSHGGGYDGMYSHLLLVPEEKLGVVVLTNSMTSIPETITNSLIDRILNLPNRDWSSENLDFFKKSRRDFRAKIDKLIKPVAEGTKPSQELKAYAGAYTCPLYGDAKVEVENEKLVLRLLPNPLMVADLEHLHYDTWVIRWRNTFAWFDEGIAQFVPDAKGQFTEIRLDVPNDDLWFHELQLKRQ